MPTHPWRDTTRDGLCHLRKRYPLIPQRPRSSAPDHEHTALRTKKFSTTEMGFEGLPDGYSPDGPRPPGWVDFYFIQGRWRPSDISLPLRSEKVSGIASSAGSTDFGREAARAKHAGEDVEAVTSKFVKRTPSTRQKQSSAKLPGKLSKSTAKEMASVSTDYHYSALVLPNTELSPVLDGTSATYQRKGLLLWMRRGECC